MTKLHEWEAIEYGPDKYPRTARLAVPGGWTYVRRPPIGQLIPLGFVPDPTAPHCQPTPAEGPPMTDEALRAWLTATYGEPAHTDETSANGVHYKATHWVKYFSDDEDDFVEVATRIRDDWQTHHGGDWLPAWIIGPALWAAHKYGVQS
jgi:hypothetical protein